MAEKITPHDPPTDPEDEFAVSHPAWTDETVGRFWDYWAMRDVGDAEYFGHIVGDGLVNLARWYGCLDGDVLDYGCAKGHLTAKLLDEAVTVAALDFSAASIAMLNEQFTGRPNWRGGTAITSLPSPLDSESFDLIYCVEVVEHLLPEWEQPTLNELARLVRPGGHLILTTPLAEDLKNSHVFCPFCRSAFHQMQHVRSITKEQLTVSLEGAGFQVRFCRGINLQNFQQLLTFPHPRLWSYDVIKRVIGYRVLKSLDKLWPASSGPNRRFHRSVRQPGEHLVTIATRPGVSR